MCSMQTNFVKELFIMITNKELMALIVKQAQKIAKLEQKLAAAEESRDYWYKQQMQAAGNPELMLFGGEQ